ncbi:MAG: hypothetical protein ONA90_10645, partial [candidate division KSB1 bacterium]|nr:hypothetical protein [candidate division KSB1 bacterium]
PANFISCLFVASRNRVWVGSDTDTAGVGIFENQRWYRLRVGRFEAFENGRWVVRARFSSDIGPRDNRINAISEDPAKGIWIGSDTGARRFSGTLDRASVLN